MGVDENAPQAFNAETLDKAHASHICSQVIHLDSPFNSLDGVSVPVPCSRLLQLPGLVLDDPYLSGKSPHGIYISDAFVRSDLERVGP